jgi:penicillin amidase
MAIRWTALDPDDPTMRAGLKLNLARSVEDAMAAATDFKTPQQNIVMADTAGNIGYLAAGRVPIRPANNTTQGLMPAPGWLAENDWIGEIPYEKLPRAYNPDSGYIATANQKIHAPDYPFTITRDFEDPDRYNRIVSLLTATAKHSIDSFQKIQADIYSEPAVRMRNRIVPILKGQKSIAPDMIAALETWNGEMDANQPQPLIMTAWQRAFVKRVTEDDLGPLFKDNWRLRTRFVEAILLGQSNSASWCDVQTTGVPEKCSDMIVAAMHDSIKQLSASQGADWKKWRWGNVHKAVAKHQPFSNVPQLAKFFETRVEVGGSSSTVNVAHPRIGDKGTYESDLLASYRGIFDLSDLEKSLYVMPGGQSGNVFSPQYRDMVERWAKLHYRTIPTRDTEIEVNTRNRLSLTARKS